MPTPDEHKPEPIETPPKPTRKEPVEKDPDHKPEGQKHNEGRPPERNGDQHQP